LIKSVISIFVLIIFFSCENSISSDSELIHDSTTTENLFVVPQNFKDGFHGCWQEFGDEDKPTVAFRTQTYDLSIFIEIGFYKKQMFVRTSDFKAAAIDSITLGHTNIIQGKYLYGMSYARNPCVELTASKNIYISDSITLSRGYRSYITLASGEKVMATMTNDTTYFDENEYYISQTGTIEESKTSRE